MKYTYIFPSILIALDMLSAIAYGFSRDWHQVTSRIGSQPRPCPPA